MTCRHSLLLALCACFSISSHAAENPASSSYLFTALKSPVGMQMTQEISMNLELKTSLFQAGKTVSTKTSNRRLRQRRIVTVLKPGPGEKARAKVRYEMGLRALSQAEEPAGAVSQPVVGKTYFVARVGSQLTVVDAQGQQPPPEELTIVKENMQALGRVNPIARFLDQRRLSIGQKVSLPKEFAQDLFNMKSVEDVSRLEMTLIEVRRENAQACAVIKVYLQSKSSANDGLAMQLQGQLLVEIDTCRTLKLHFSGPVGFIKSGVLPGTGAIASGRGKLNLAMQTSYRTASLR